MEQEKWLLQIEELNDQEAKEQLSKDEDSDKVEELVQEEERRKREKSLKHIEELNEKTRQAMTESEEDTIERVLAHADRRDGYNSQKLFCDTDGASDENSDSPAVSQTITTLTNLSTSQGVMLNYCRTFFSNIQICANADQSNSIYVDPQTGQVTVFVSS